MTVLATAQRLLHAAQERYGIKQAESAHVMDGGLCWCGPERQCAWCRSVAPCSHGSGGPRPEIVIHKRAC